ncbi:MAG TPA: PIN domain-containing protein [Thermoanaerobaculia bacterium]
MTAFQAALEGVQKLGIDTAPLIYFVESHPDYAPLTRIVIERAEAGELKLVTSTLTLTEVLTLPFQKQAAAIADAYKAILLGSSYTDVLPIDVEIAERAARLRVQYRLKTPDALQIAVALHSNCGAFLTNDDGLKRVRDLPVLVLSDFG